MEGLYFDNFYNSIRVEGLEKWEAFFRQVLGDDNPVLSHGDLPVWRDLVQRLPDIEPSLKDFNSSCITVGNQKACTEKQKENIRRLLKDMMPWRKGPYNIFGVKIDTEWRSDWKWDRVTPHISSLPGRNVLDVGCGNGYHAWRMYGSGASMVVGIDPSALFMAQFLAIRRYAGVKIPVHFLPLGIEKMPDNMEFFDTVFSMGVMYHRRSPFDHLFKLRDLIRPGGELVLETLVIEGKDGETLVPKKRYAKMRNVWFIPSCLSLENWLKRTGFVNCSLVNLTSTTVQEQRKTDWMIFESLADFLDPENPDFTIEGYPAPLRGIFTAQRPS